MLTGKPLPLKARTNGFRVSLLAGAVLGALSLSVPVAHAVTLSTPVEVNENWQAFQVVDDDKDFDLIANQMLVQESGEQTIQIEKTFTQADFDAVKATEGFGDFGKVGIKGDGQPGIQVSSANGLYINGQDTKLTANNASIVLSSEALSGNPYVEVSGVNHREGQASYTGKTEIRVSSNAVMDADEESYVAGYLIENPLGAAQSQRVVSFAGETNISASATNANGLDVIGFSLAADAVDNPTVSFDGTTSVSSSNAATNRVSFALWMHNSDGNVGESASMTLADGASLTLNAEGGIARGLFVDHGSFTSYGTLTVNAEANNGNDVVAIYASDDGNLQFNGTTVATAEGNGNAYALFVGANDFADEATAALTPVVAFNAGSTTTLNGAVFVDQGMTVTMNGTTTVNGGLELSGSINGTGSLTINGEGTTGTLAEGATLTQGSLTFQNGAFENNGQIEVSGDVTLNNVTFTNTVKNDVEVGGSVTLGNGTTLINHGGFHSNDWVLSAGSVYQEEASELGADGIMQMDSGRFEMAGGTFGIIDNAATVNGWLVAPDPEDQNAVAPELVFSAGNYDYTSITVDGAESNLSVTGGTVTLDTLTIEQGVATISGGSVETGTLTVSAANGLTIGGADGTASLTVNDKISDVASSVTVGVNGTFATNVGTIGFKDLDEGYEVSGDFNTVSVAAGGTMRVEGFDGVSLSIAELADLKTKLAGADSEGLLDLVGDISITDLTINDGKVTAESVENLGNTTTDALKEATVTDVTEEGITGSYKAVELAENTQALSVSSGALTLNGSAEGGDLVTKGSGETATTAGIEVAGQVATIGNAEAANKGTVASVTLNEGATVNVVGTTGATFTLGTVTTADAASGENVVNVLGAKAEATVIGGSVAVNVGSSDVAGHVEVEKLTTSGLIFLDPAWKGNDKIEDGSFLTAADVDADNKLNAQIVVGQNSTVAIGATKDQVVESFAQTGLQYGQDGVTAVFYAQKAISLSDTGAILVNGDLTEAPGSVTGGTFQVTKNGLAVIDGDAITEGKAAITATTITFDEGSHIRVVGLGEDKMSGQLFSATSLTIDQTVLDDASRTAVFTVWISRKTVPSLLKKSLRPTPSRPSRACVSSKCFAVWGLTKMLPTTRRPSFRASTTTTT